MTRRRRDTELNGKRLGEFVIEEKVGAGGFGVVYRASQPLLERQAVVKVLHTQLRGASEVTDRFLREARLASRLDHPYAAHIYAFGAEADGTLWIAMELVRGSTLASYLKTHGPLPLERFVPLIERICEVVHTAHTQGIVHRDLKPANVMVLSRAGRLLPKLLDFGIAKSLLASSMERDSNDNEAALVGLDAPAERAGSPEPTQAVAIGATLRPDAIADDATLSPDSVAGDATLAPDSVADDATLPPDSSAGDATTPNRSGRGGPSDSGRSGASRGQMQAMPGSSELTRALTGYGAMMGSPQYMAPEQWSDAATAGPPADLYALGVLAYEALTGAPPFFGRLDELRASHASAPVPPLAGHLPQGLDAVFARALAKDPAERYGDALEMAAALREASGLSAKRAPLPRLDEVVSERFLSSGPQPLAEAITAFEATRDPRQARDALWGVVSTLARYVALTAVAAWARYANRDAPPRVSLALRELGTKVLETGDWIAIGRALTRPYAEQPDLHPLPELVLFFWATDKDPAEGAQRFDSLESLREGLADPNAGDEQLYRRLAEAVVALSALLRSADFVCAYALVVPRNEGAVEHWVGVRRARTPMPLPDVELAPDRPILVDRDNALVVSLFPLLQVAPPTPGAPPELFLYAGCDNRGPRLTSVPMAFERHDGTVRAWLREQLATTLDTQRASGPEKGAPYLGLRAFSSEDADRFLGRERQVETFINRLRVQPLLAVVGQSGAGKSSFIQAGVLPNLEGWRAITLRPGGAPMSALAAHVGALDDPAKLGDRLREDAATGGPIVLVVDQLEELFTLCRDEDQRLAFATAIASAARAIEDPVRVVLTLRDDFLVQAESLASLSERLGRGLQLLTTPAQDELERIVREPARRAGYEFEDPELPAQMVAEVADQPGALALISFTASVLWEHRDHHFMRIPSRAYEAIGGVGGALAQHAEKLLESLPSERRGVVRSAFAHLVTAEGTRAVLARDELVELCGGGASAESVIETLIDGRLLITAESEDGADRIEIIHEALLSAWPRLVGWLREAEDGARLRDQLRGAVKQWEARERPRALLWRDELLIDLRRWLATEPALTSAESAFAEASIADAARGRRLRRRAVIASLALLSIGVVLLLWLNNRVAEQRSLAEDQRAVAEDQSARAEQRLDKLYEENGRQALLARDYFSAAVYLSAAYSRGVETPALRFMLAQALRPMRSPPVVARHGEPITWVSFSPDGSRIVTCGIMAHQPKVWSVDGELLYALPVQDSIVRMAVFDRGGGRLATAGADGFARVFDGKTGAPELELQHGAPVRWVAFDPAGERLASGGLDGMVKIWSLDGGALAHTLESTGGADTIAWSPEGDRLAIGTTIGHVQLWDVERGALLHDRAAHAERVFRLLYPSSDLVISAGFDGVAKAWDPKTGSDRIVAKHSANIWDVAIDPQGRMLATAGGEGTARLWDLDGRQVAVLDGHRGSVFSVSFSPDGQRLLTTSFDGTARLWDRTGISISVLAGQSAAFYRGQFDPSGERVAIAALDGTLNLWPATRTLPIKIVSELESRVRSVNFSYDAKVLVLVTLDGRIRVVGARDGEPRAELVTPAGPSIGVALSDDSLAVAHEGKLSILSYSGETRAEHSINAAIWDARVSPSGEWLVTLSDRIVATLWKVRGGTLEKVSEVAARWGRFTHDDQLLAVSIKGGVVRYDPATREETLRIDEHRAQAIYPCTNGRFVTVTDNNTVVRWTRDGERLGSRQLKSHYVLAEVDESCESIIVFGDLALPTVVDLETGRALDFLDLGLNAASYLDVAPSGDVIVIALKDRVALWNLERITETPAEVDALVRCTVPYRIVGAELQATTLEPCDP